MTGKNHRLKLGVNVKMVQKTKTARLTAKSAVLVNAIKTRVLVALQVLASQFRFDIKTEGVNV